MGKLTPENFIKEIRDVAPYMEIVFGRGGCWKLYKILKMVFPIAEPYFLCDASTCHVVIKIKGKFYDIEGNVEKYKTRLMPFNEKNFPQYWKQKDEWICHMQHLFEVQLNQAKIS